MSQRGKEKDRQTEGKTDRERGQGSAIEGERKGERKGRREKEREGKTRKEKVKGEREKG